VEFGGSAATTYCEACLKSIPRNDFATHVLSKKHARNVEIERDRAAANGEKTQQPQPLPSHAHAANLSPTPLFFQGHSLNNNNNSESNATAISPHSLSTRVTNNNDTTSNNNNSNNSGVTESVPKLSSNDPVVKKEADSNPISKQDCPITFDPRADPCFMPLECNGTTRYYCRLCDACTTSDGTFQAHVTGRNHVKKVFAFENGVYCDVCDVREDRQHASLHLTLQSHLKNLETRFPQWDHSITGVKRCFR
jgi:hypothetical protein